MRDAMRARPYGEQSPATGMGRGTRQILLASGLARTSPSRRAHEAQACSTRTGNRWAGPSTSSRCVSVLAGQAGLPGRAELAPTGRKGLRAIDAMNVAAGETAGAPARERLRSRAAPAVASSRPADPRWRVCRPRPHDRTKPEARRRPPSPIGPRREDADLRCAPPCCRGRARTGSPLQRLLGMPTACLLPTSRCKHRYEASREMDARVVWPAYKPQSACRSVGGRNP